MSETIIVAVLSLAGTAIGLLLECGCLFIVLSSSKKMDKHNNFMERAFCLEGRMTEVEHDVSDLKHHSV